MLQKFVVVSLAMLGGLHVAHAQAPASQPLPDVIGAAVAKQSALKPSTPESRSAAALAQSGEPVFDDGSARRIKDAIKLAA